MGWLTKKLSGWGQTGKVVLRDEFLVFCFQKCRTRGGDELPQFCRRAEGGQWGRASRLVIAPTCHKSGVPPYASRRSVWKTLTSAGSRVRASGPWTRSREPVDKSARAHTGQIAESSALRESFLTICLSFLIDDGCTSSEAIAPFIEADNTCLGHPAIPVGTPEDLGFLLDVGQSKK